MTKQELSPVMEQLLKALVNEMDEVIQKLDINSEMNVIQLAMTDGSKYLVYCEKILAESGYDKDILASYSTIRDLYLGNLSPCDFDIDIPDYKIELKELSEEYEKVIGFIPADLCGTFEQTCIMETEINRKRQIKRVFSRPSGIGRIIL